MTEQQWLTSREPKEMVRLITENPDHQDFNCASDRKLQLFVEAVNCRECESHFGDETWGWRAGYVAGASCSTPEAKANLLRCIMGNIFRPVTLPPDWLTPQVVSLAQAAYGEGTKQCPHCEGRNSGIWAHPCRTCNGTGRVTEDTRLSDGTLDPECLAMLSDALEEAGCADEAILRHLRGFRLCWACRGGEPPERHRGALTGMCVECLDDPGWEPSDNPHVHGCAVNDAILQRS